jgi:hypothetical protein
VESTLVPVFLEELLLAFGLLLAQLVRAFEVLLESLLLRHGPPPLDLFAFLLARNLFLLLLLDSCQLPQSPGLELAFGIQTVSIVDVRDIIFFLFCAMEALNIGDTTDREMDKLSANSLLIDSATRVWLCLRRSSASSSFFRWASSVS